jgi:DNA polymerase-1
VSKIYLIDGSGFIFRAFHALPPLKSPEGTPVGAVFGFCNMILRVFEQLLGDRVLVVFDKGGSTFRRSIYAEYKSHRPETPEELKVQFPLIREACIAFKIPYVELEGCEADDLIASYTQVALEKGYQVTIVSSDKDLTQLVDTQVCMWDPIKQMIIKVPEVIEKLGVSPQSVPDLLGLVGDRSDNIPGVPGIGPKTAVELLKTYKNLEEILEDPLRVISTRRRQLLVDHADQARLSKNLATVLKDVPLPLPFLDIPIHTSDREYDVDFLGKLGFHSLIKKLSSRLPSPVSSDYECIDSLEALNPWISWIETSGICVIDVETTSLNIHDANLVGISIATYDKARKRRAAYIPIMHQGFSSLLLKQTILEKLSPLLMDPSIRKIGHNFKYDLSILLKEGLNVDSVDDTLLMSYVLDAGKNLHNLDDLALLHLNHSTIKYRDVVGAGKNQKTFDQVPVDLATKYAAEDADVTLRLYEIFRKRLIEEKRLTLYEEIEKPLVPVISFMESEGIQVEPKILDKLDNEFEQKIKDLEVTIHKLAGRNFNIGSPKQLGEILFVEHGMPGSKKSKTGSFVTDADVLENLSIQGFDLPKYVLEWRGLTKLQSTYVQGLLKAIHPQTGRIHASFSLAGTSTGRLSSSDPNLQNIPIRTEDGRKIRHSFVAREGFVLASFDYSQIELRLLAHFADIPVLREAFMKGQDIHRLTASQIFGIPLEDVTAEQRRQAKTINFGIIYGISSYGLSQQLGVPTSVAHHLIQTYMKQYPGIEAYMEECKLKARQQGYVETIYGRRCFILGIHDKNPSIRQFAERQAINAPLQGSNADIIKKAMHRTYRLCLENPLDLNLLLQVHDELVFEVREEKIDNFSKKIRDIMQNIVALKVPCIVEGRVGKNWAETF